jgi:RluA family pseudouridine synthase
MAKPREIELPDGTVIPILYEDRAVLAIDKPAGWLLVPSEWDATSRNLQRALESGINGGEFWARSRNLKYLRFVHRLDAETSGVLLLVKSPGALRPYSKLFETREVQKTYLAVVAGIPKQKTWTCKLPIAPDPSQRGRMRITAARLQPKEARDTRSGKCSETKSAETVFRVVCTGTNAALVEARPITGRTHQIRVHLMAAGHPVLGDPDYAASADSAVQRSGRDISMALRAIALAYKDPFTGKSVRITAPWQEFARKYGFTVTSDELFGRAERQTV